MSIMLACLKPYRRAHILGHYTRHGGSTPGSWRRRKWRRHSDNSENTVMRVVGCCIFDCHYVLFDKSEDLQWYNPFFQNVYRLNDIIP